MAMIVSFAWTSLALVSGRKTVTRREYDWAYCQRFKKGNIVDAYDRSPRNRGVKIATIKLTESAYRAPLSVMPDADYEGEGFAFYDELTGVPRTNAWKLVRENFDLRPGETLRDHFRRQREVHGPVKMAVLRFELIDVTVAGVLLAQRFGVEPWES